MGTSRLILAGWLGILSSGALQVAAAEPSAKNLEFFERKVRPVLAENCFSCHGEEKQKGKLRLDSAASVRAGGENGAILGAGQPADSRLLLAVSHQDPDLKMPPKKQLAKQQVADLTEWVKLGAPMPTNFTAEVASAVKKEFVITAKDRSHWAFQPLQRPEVPKTARRQPANPIDAFVLARLKTKSLEPNPSATRVELIRRATYDLTGLPPSPAEVEAFLGDSSPLAWEKLIDRLLESPRYGEKWGRHWLDLVRFAESNSYERDGEKPNAWRYRDYVIRSLNADKPYDQFVREQLAGDEFPKPDADAIIATGFYRLGIWDDEPADKNLARYDGLDDIVATTGQTFLGLTLDCARCHNHKLDPIPQSDYYRFLSFFHNISPYTKEGAEVMVPLPGRPHERALAVTERGPKAPDTFVLLRGNPENPGDKVEPGFLRVLGEREAKVTAGPLGARTSGRRTLLAEWIASPENPLTPRVMANRIWQHHFGRGLVRSPNNFGLQGDAPTHPELLDWLASEFTQPTGAASRQSAAEQTDKEGGARRSEPWSMKHLHRLIMTSQAYQMSSRGRPDGLKADPANQLLWRFDMRRLSAEEVRDSVLAIDGSLNLKMFGPGVFVDIPKEVMAGQSDPGKGWGSSPAAEQARRSIYIHVKRSLLTPILESFDLAETDRSTPVRFSTVQPTQALGLINSTFLNREAEIFGARLRKEAGSDLQKQIQLGLSLVTSRPPTSDEIKRGLRLIESLQAEDHATPEVALKYFCLMALNLNEMVYLD